MQMNDTQRVPGNRPGASTRPELIEERLTETRMIYPIFPGSTNHYDTLFGGQVMAWMDQAAFICATRWCRRKVVTAYSSAIDFHIPVPVGTIVELVGRLTKVGRSSMTVMVEMWFEPMDRPERTLACEGSFVMVAVDMNNQPVPVPPLPDSVENP